MKKPALPASVALVVSALLVLSAHVASAQTLSFPDVPAHHWAAPAVTALAKAGIVNGYGVSPFLFAAPGKTAKVKSTYDGNKPVTRYELATTLYRFIQYMERVDKTPKSKSGAFTNPKTPRDTIKKMVADGYLSPTLAFVKNAATGGNNLVTADEFANALGDVLSKIREKKTPMSTDALDIPKPTDTDEKHGH